jgi:ribosomal subunit interface protein
MQVEFRTANTDLSGALTYHIQRRLRFALSRVADRVSHVSARVSGTAGREVQCQLSAEVKPFGRVTVQASAPDLMSSIDGAVGKLKRLLERERHKALDSRQPVRVAA